MGPACAKQTRLLQVCGLYSGTWLMQRVMAPDDSLGELTVLCLTQFLMFWLLQVLVTVLPCSALSAVCQNPSLCAEASRSMLVAAEAVCCAAHAAYRSGGMAACATEHASFPWNPSVAEQTHTVRYMYCLEGTCVLYIYTCCTDV